MSGGRVAVGGEVEDLGPWEHNVYFSLGRGFAPLTGNAVGLAGMFWNFFRNKILRLQR